MYLSNLIFSILSHSLSNSIQAVGKKADEYIIQRDEEYAYVMYMKYFLLIDYVRGREDYQKEKAILREVLGSNATITKRMDTLHTLKKSLEKR